MPVSDRDKTFGAFVRSEDQRAQPATERLENRLEAFYASSQGYYELASGTSKDYIYEAVGDRLRHRVEAQGRVRILEVGAGRTSFPAYLKKRGLLERVDFCAHDIVDQNVEFYRENNIGYVIGKVSDIGIEPVDIVLSTYVFEHVPRPVPHLNKLTSLLRDKGELVIVCPKYTFPGYVPPAIRHLPAHEKLMNHLFLVGSNLVAALRGRTNFWIVTDPAVFHRPWRRDFDAIHMVSETDLRNHLRQGYRVERLSLAEGSLKGLLTRLMVMAIRAQKK